MTVSTALYNQLGRQTELDEMNSGKTIYQYNLEGELIRQDFNNGKFVHNMAYDVFGNLISKSNSDGTSYSYSYNYDPNVNGVGQLLTEEITSPLPTAISYTYNAEGRVHTTSELIQNRLFTEEYLYYPDGKLYTHTYGNDLGNRSFAQSTLQYTYTTKGYLEKIHNAMNPSSIYFLAEERNALGQWEKYKQVSQNSTQISYSYDSNQDYLMEVDVLNASYYGRKYTFDPENGNLKKRERIYGGQPTQYELFSYDGRNRLTGIDVFNNGVQQGNTLNMSYQDNGNIATKYDAGVYSYHPSMQNAVIKATNPNSAINANVQNISYDAHHNPTLISENGNSVDFQYGADQQRRVANHTDANGQTKILYSRNGEFEVDMNYDIVKSVEYISSPVGLVAMEVDLGGGLTETYAVYTDHLGSIELLVNTVTSQEIEQSFDAWGRSRDPQNWSSTQSFGWTTPGWLRRGYTGHEHLSNFQLVHMNGRLYDPILGRMLSPDNFVQDPSNAQNYNRYSYAYNNPLKYTDPDGEVIVTAFIVGAVISGGVGYISGRNAGLRGNDLAAFTIGSAVIGGISGGVGAGVGSAVSAALPSTLGGFAGGAIAGAAGGAAGGFIGGFGSTALGNSTFGTNNNVWMGGLTGAGYGALAGGIIGGVTNGIQAYRSGGSFWDGQPRTDGTQFYAREGTDVPKDYYDNLESRARADFAEGKETWRTRLYERMTEDINNPIALDATGSTPQSRTLSIPERAGGIEFYTRGSVPGGESVNLTLDGTPIRTFGSGYRSSFTRVPGLYNGTTIDVTMTGRAIAPSNRWEIVIRPSFDTRILYYR